MFVKKEKPKKRQGRFVIPLNRMGRTVLAFLLSAAMVFPLLLNGNNSTEASQMQTQEKIIVPKPIKVYDFESGLKGVQLDENEDIDSNYRIVKSKEVYVQKTAEEVTGYEYVDANGLVYFGGGDNIRYQKTQISNQPSTMFDEEKGTVLKLGNAVTIPQIIKTKSAAITNDALGTETLDKEIPVSKSEVVQPEYTCYSELTISNPFAGLDMQEYDELYEMTKGNGGLVLYGDKYCPYWEKGLTMSYWIKVPANEDGTYKNSSALRWELDNQNYYQVDNYAIHLTCKKYDTEIAEYTEEEKAGFNESGVAEDSKYYFTIIEDSYINGEGTEGPVYGTVGKYAFCNKNYREGFQKTSNGGYEKVYVLKDDAYKNYSTIPTEVSPEEYNEILALGATEAAATIEERNIRRQDFIEGERYMEFGKSKVRFAEEDGEFQVDVDNSTFFCPDNIKGIDANINESISYGQTNGMHNGDVFFMNSWREGSLRENKSGYSYQSSAYQAESPVTKVEMKQNEKGKEYLDATKNGNVNTWQHVTITMQNDWIEFYMNGKCVEVRYNYSSRGELCLDQGESFKRFNKGAGLRYGYGSEKQVGSIMFGYYVARLFMDWITDPEAILHIGGTGDYAGDYNCATKGCEFAIDDLTFYDELLDEDQIMAAYQKSLAKKNETANVSASGTSIDLSEATLSADGAAKVGTATINENSYATLEVDENLNSSTNISATLANPFAGKKLEGATIAYWMKQDARTGEKTAQATAGISFMDSPKWVENVKDFDSSSKASSIIYTKTNGIAEFREAYSDSNNSTALKNSFYTAPDATEQGIMVNDAYDWHFYTLTFTNAGIVMYVDGKAVDNCDPDAAYGIRFLDGYFQREANEAEKFTRFGVYGGTNNQGATTLMDFLTYADTAIHVGQMPVPEGTFEKTNPTSYAGMVSYDTELTAEQVLKLYQLQLEAPTTPEPESTIMPTPKETLKPEPTITSTPTPGILDPGVTDSQYLTGKKNEDGTYTITVNVRCDVSMFDFGVVYDDEKIEYVNAKWNSKFDDDFDELQGIKLYKDMGTYVVLGGTCGAECPYEGALIDITFKVKDEMTESGKVTLVCNSKKLYQRAESMGKQLDMNLAKENGWTLYDLKQFDSQIPAGILKYVATPIVKGFIKEILGEATRENALNYLNEFYGKVNGMVDKEEVMLSVVWNISEFLTKPGSVNRFTWRLADAVLEQCDTSGVITGGAVEIANPDTVPTFKPEETAVPSSTPTSTLKPEETAVPSSVPISTPKPEETAVPSSAPMSTPKPEETTVPNQKPTQTPFPSAGFKRGDVDENNRVDLSDANMILKVALGIVNLSGKLKDAADVDGNNKIELTDANMVLKAALGIVVL